MQTKIQAWLFDTCKTYSMDCPCTLFRLTNFQFFFIVVKVLERKQEGFR